MIKVSPYRTSFTQIMLLCTILFFFSAPAFAEDITFTWTANPEPVTGYKLYYKTGEDSSPPYNGTGLNEGSSPILTGKVTSYVVTGRNTTEKYHFVLQAFNSEGESGYTAPVTVAALTSPDTTSPVIKVIKLN